MLVMLRRCCASANVSFPDATAFVCTKQVKAESCTYCFHGVSAVQEEHQMVTDGQSFQSAANRIAQTV